MNFISEIELDVILNILKYPDALAPRRGKLVKNGLAEKLDGIEYPTLFHINLRKADPIDYLFTREAFGDFYKRTLDNDDLDVIFYIQTNSQKSNLLKGVLHSVNPEFKSVGSIEDNFMFEGLSIKIANGKDLFFISSIIDLERLILDFINTETEVNIHELTDKFRQEYKLVDITKAIENLKSKKIIYSIDENNPEILLSIKSKLKHYE